MANNRLYIVDMGTKEYVCIAKTFGIGWDLGNVTLLKSFLENVTDFENSTNLIIGTENDAEFYDKYIKDGVNKNELNTWDYE